MQIGAIFERLGWIACIPLQLLKRVKLIDLVDRVEDAADLDVARSSHSQITATCPVNTYDESAHQTRRGDSFEERPMQCPDVLPGRPQVEMVVDAKHGLDETSDERPRGYDTSAAAGDDPGSCSR